MIPTQFSVRHTRDDSHLPGGLPLACDLHKSGGAYLADARSGRDYLDFVGHATGMPLGYNHPKLARDDTLVAALRRLALHRPINCETQGNELAVFSETFDIVPLGGQFAHLMFTESDWAGVEVALGAAIAWKHQKNILAKTKRRGTQIIHFHDCDHGSLGMALAFTDASESDATQYVPRLKWPRVSNPVISFPGDEEALRNVQLEEGRALAQIRAVFENSPGEIAAIVIEPIQSYGDGFFRSEFLTLLRQICDERDSILIFDERLTGFGVTAQWWDWQNHGVKPDILIFGDRAQVSGIAATERLDEVGPLLRDFANSQQRFSGNLLDMVRCQRIIEIIRDDDLLANARNMGAYLLKLLSDLPKSHSEVSGVRGRGLWAGFDLPSTEERDRVAWSCYDEQLLVARSGSRTIRLRPTLDVNADAVGRAVAQLEAGIRRAYGRRA